MPKIPIESPLDFLVRRKFGRTEHEDFFVSPRVDVVPGQREDREAFNEKLRIYREELATKSPDQIAALCAEEKRKQQEERTAKALREEQAYSFNQSSATADYEHWSKCAQWTIDEAVALSFGRDPRIVKWENLKSMTMISAFAREYEARRDLALRALPWKLLFDPVVPTFFLAWARQLDIVVPEQLAQGVERYGGLIANWKDMYDRVVAVVRDQKETIALLSTTVESYKSTVENQSALIAAHREKENADPGTPQTDQLP